MHARDILYLLYVATRNTVPAPFTVTATMVSYGTYVCAVYIHTCAAMLVYATFIRLTWGARANGTTRMSTAHRSNRLRSYRRYYYYNNNTYK